MWFSVILFAIFIIFYSKAETEYESAADEASTMFDIAGLLMKSISLIDPDLSFTTYKTSFKCSNGTIPVAFAINSDGLPVVSCKLAECLDPNKVVCERLDGIHECDLENEWVSGFIDTFTKIHTTETECCRYRSRYSLAFVRKMNVTRDESFSRNDYYENEKQVAFEVFKDIQKKYDVSNQTYYSISVYRMTCPGATFSDSVITRTNENPFAIPAGKHALPIVSKVHKLGYDLQSNRGKPSPLRDLLKVMSKQLQDHLATPNPLFPGVKTSFQSNFLPSP